MKLVRVWGIAVLVSTALFSGLALSATPADKPASEASIRELIEITQVKKLLDNMSGQIDSAMQASMKQALAGQSLSPEQQKVMDEMRGKMVKLVSDSLKWDQLETVFIDIYTKTFTQREVEGMLSFYKTDAGKALIVKMPLVMQNSMQTMQSQMATLMPKIQQLQQETMEKMKAVTPK